jgi:hypothetical protein
MYNMSYDELERFVTDWVSTLGKAYPGGYDRFSGPGDMGRDVVGYLTQQRLDGAWHNYQCKQLKRTLDDGSVLLELGKIFFYSAQGHFGLPEKMYFVAPRGVSRNAKAFESKPSALSAALITQWDQNCATKIEEGKSHVLDEKLRGLILSYDFSNVGILDAYKIAKLPTIKPVLVNWFGEDPGQYPSGSVPVELQKEEETYIDHLLAAYGERSHTDYPSSDAVLADVKYGPHLRDQRTRYFEANWFMRYYRDNTPTGTVEGFKEEVYHGVIDEHRRDYNDALARVDSVLSQAAKISVTGTLSRYAKIPVKQGTCHHLVNEGNLSWKP